MKTSSAALAALILAFPLVAQAADQPQGTAGQTVTRQENAAPAKAPATAPATAAVKAPETKAPEAKVPATMPTGPRTGEPMPASK